MSRLQTWGRPHVLDLSLCCVMLSVFVQQKPGIFCCLIRSWTEKLCCSNLYNTRIHQGFFFFLYCSLDCSPAFLDDKQLTLCVLRMYFIYSSKRKINVIANYVCWYDFNFVCSLCVFLLLFLHIERILNN